MSQQHYGEKEEEKTEEKEQEKRYEKQEKEEKARGEKWRRDPLSAIVWAAIFIWAGLVLLAGNLQQFGAFDSWFGIPHLSSWAIVLVGAGVIVLLEIIVRLLVPAYRRPIGGSAIFAAVLVTVGLGMVWDISVTWPIILVIIGLSIILGGLFRRRW